MKILHVHIDGFGKLSQRDFSFEDGLNLVYGKNEAGKSTLHTFIRGMLFGIERQRGRASKKDTYSRYEPWFQSGTYEGWIRVESQGEIFRIERKFQKNNKSLVIINETTGKEEKNTGAILDRLRGGLSETAYDNTISIGQLKCATESGMVAELRNYIANLNTSGSAALNITKASAYLKNQRKQLESKLIPEAAKEYTSLLSEIKKTEQEISDPRYANQLTACRQKKSAVKKKLEHCQKEKEGLLEKTAKGRQILAGGQFNAPSTVETCLKNTEALYTEYQRAKEEADKKSRTLLSGLFFFAAILCAAIALCFFGKPGFFSPVFTIFSDHLPEGLLTPFVLGTGIFALLFFVLALLLQAKKRRYKKEWENSGERLKEVFSRYLEGSAISPEAMENFRGRMAEFLRLSRAVVRSEEMLKHITEELSSLQAQEEHISEELETQQRTQWELEQRLAHLSACKDEAERFRHLLAENERIEEELAAIDLAQETMTNLSSSIRDSFGLYLNKTASELIEGITGGIYKSMSIDQNLNVFMNTPTRLVPIDQVSSGTMDQIYLAVRLAAAKLMQEGKEPMPLIFDDSFTLYDEDRLKTALKWLSKAYGNQIIIFTCHQREAQLLTANQIPYHLVEL